MDVKTFEKNIIKIENQRIAIENSKRIMKDMEEKEMMCIKNDKKMINYFYEINVEKEILCAMIPELLKLIKNKSIVVEYDVKNGVRKAIITIS